MAKRTIAGLTMRENRYSALVFRQVLPGSTNQMPKWTVADAKPFVKATLDVSLEAVRPHKLYFADKTKFHDPVEQGDLTRAEISAGGREILKQLQKRGAIDPPLNEEGDFPKTREAAGKYVEAFFEHATKADNTYLYVYNCEEAPKGVTTGDLEGINGHLSPTKNTRLNKIPGINTDMFYVGSPGSFTEMHAEDGLTDSVNLNLAGKEKIWLIVAREHYRRLNEIIQEVLEEDQRKNDPTTNCPLPLHHKNIVVTPRFLDEHQIKYQFIVQGAGDLVYVRYGVAHQVINVGTNIAVARNVGSDSWNFINDVTTICTCGNTRVRSIESNAGVDMMVKTGKKRRNEHLCNTCKRTFETKKLLQKHETDDHHAKWACPSCGKEYGCIQSLQRHVRVNHFQPPTTTDAAAANVTAGGASGEGNASISATANTCLICGKTSKDLVRHVRERHKQQVECRECKAKFTRYELAKHEKN